MNHNKLQIANVSVTYEDATGAIVLTSKDAKLRHRPFQIKLTSQTPTYQTLYNLLDEEGYILEDVSEFSTFDAKLKSLDELKADGDSRVNFNIGRNTMAESLIIDRSEYSHMLIYGATAEDRLSAQQLILAYGMTQQNIALWGIDLEENLSAKFFSRTQDRLAKTEEDALELLERVDKQIEFRYTQLRNIDRTSFIQTELPAIYLFIDEIAPFLGNSYKNHRIADLLTRIARFGKGAGIMLCLSSSDFQKRLPETLKNNLSIKAIVGNAKPEEINIALELKPSFGMMKELQDQAPGQSRAIIQKGRKSPELVQLFQTDEKSIFSLLKNIS